MPDSNEPIGLSCCLGVLDEQAYRRHLEPAFVCSSEALDHEPLLQLAEALSDALASPELQSKPNFAATSAELDELHELCDAWLDCAQDAEDAGFRTDNLGCSPWAHRFFVLRDQFVSWSIRHTEVLTLLLDEAPRGPQEPPHEPLLSYEESRLCLQFCLSVATGVHTLSAASLTHRDYLSQLGELRVDFEMMSLVCADWTEWPPFQPDRVLTTAGTADHRFETPTDFDWTIRSAHATAELATQLRRILRRFVHLEYLRLCRAELYAELCELLLDGLDASALQAYERLIEEVPWTPPFADCWRYLCGELPHCPRPLPMFNSLSGFPSFAGSRAQPSSPQRDCSSPFVRDDASSRVVEQALAVYRQTLLVVQSAERRSAGLYLLIR